MNDGVAWLARENLTWLGYCVTLARGMEPEELVRRLSGDEAPEELGDHGAEELVGFLARRDRDRGRGDSVAVRYGTSGDLSFAVAYGQWPGSVGPGCTDGLSVRDDHVFQLSYETQNPKLPPPEFNYFRDGVHVCGFQMYMHTWSHEITGLRPELLSDAVQAVGIPDEDDRDAAHAKSLAVVEQAFRLTLPRDRLLHQAVPAALIKGQTPA
ncbi:DUF6461 domain-containing protein [Streptomyces sp. NPDC057002]|uniref:DUF6461 domain-containing protein n=1 Tax=Streptomyces sp. NPDC057002 TaxID=3345992 RepID=UPI003638C3A4